MFFPSQKNKKNKRSAFTLVETLVAVAILLVGVTATFSAVHLGLSSTSAVRHRITAIFLAQEALEAVKNKKDSNLLAISSPEGTPGLHWLEGVGATNGQVGLCQDRPCAYDVMSEDDELEFLDCSFADGCKVKFYEEGDGNDDEPDFYRQWAGSGLGETGFVREIYVDEITPNIEAKVRVVIRRPGTDFNNFEVVTFMYNWF